MSARETSDFKTLVNICEYGRAASARSCARRSRAADTIFMARVICRVLVTLRIRRRMSSMLAIKTSLQLSAVSLQKNKIRCRVPHFSLFLREVGNLFSCPDCLSLRDKRFFAIANHLCHVRLNAIVEDLLLHDRPQQARVRAVDIAMQFLLEIRHLLHRQIVEDTAGSGKDDQNLL